jgi:hypothetical protein
MLILLAIPSTTVFLQVESPLDKALVALMGCDTMHEANCDLWLEALTEAVDARARRSISGHGFARAGRDTTALLRCIYDTWRQVSPEPMSVFCGMQGNKPAEQFYKTLLKGIRGLNGSSEVECAGVRNMSSVQAQTELHKVLIGDGVTGGGAPVARILVVVHQVNCLGNTSMGALVIQQLLEWAHAATSRVIFIGLEPSAQTAPHSSMKAQQILVPLFLPADTATRFEPAMEATLRNVLRKGAVKLFLDPACGSSTREVLHRCMRAVDTADTDNSCTVYPRHVVYQMNARWWYIAAVDVPVAQTVAAGVVIVAGAVPAARTPAAAATVARAIV